jgi:TPR repeat protein
MDCILCNAVAWISAKQGLPSGGASLARLWDWGRAWDEAHADDRTVLDDDPQREGVIEAARLRVSDPDGAFEQFSALAQRGSASGMVGLARCYFSGVGVAANQEAGEDWYRQAAEAGSQHAQLWYGKLLGSKGDFEGAERVFNSGAEADWGPGLFWFAWYRLRQSRTVKTWREVLPLLERSASKGSPVAEWLVARNMAKGVFGLREIPRGWRRLIGISNKALSAVEAGASTD